jgi:hypothetical protein
MAEQDDAVAADRERLRLAAAVNHRLGETGLRHPGDRIRWWNGVRHAELGGRTATEAWLDGDTTAVRGLVERWHARRLLAAPTCPASRAASLRAGVPPASGPLPTTPA